MRCPLARAAVSPADPAPDHESALRLVADDAQIAPDTGEFLIRFGVSRELPADGACKTGSVGKLEYCGKPRVIGKFPKDRTDLR